VFGDRWSFWGKLWAEVEDDGRGFGPETPAEMETRGMRERARVLGENSNINSEPGKGTKVRLEMNFAREGEEPQPGVETRILLVEDHTSFRKAAASFFEQEPGFEWWGRPARSPMRESCSRMGRLRRRTWRSSTWGYRTITVAS
jgi:hypothetical protein